jgi:hypothetical protein
MSKAHGIAIPTLLNGRLTEWRENVNRCDDSKHYDDVEHESLFQVLTSLFYQPPPPGDG